MLALAILFFAIALLSGLVGLPALAGAATTIAAATLAIGLLGFAFTLVLALIGRSLAITQQSSTRPRVKV